MPKLEYVLILDVHPLEDGRIQKHIRFLQSSGYTVYHLHFIPYAADQRIDDGEYSLFGEKSWHINLNWTTRYKGLSLLNYFSVFSPALTRKMKEVIQAWGISPSSIGIIHVHDPILLPLGQKIQCKLLTHSKIVYDRHEVYEGMKRFAGIGGYRLFERIARNSVSGVVVVSDRHKDAISNFFPGAFVTTVPNFPMKSFVNEKTILDKISSFTQSSPIICIYIGSLRQYLDRDINLLLILADAILTEIPTARFFVGGPCDEDVILNKMDTLQQKFKNRFIYFGAVPYDQVIRETENAHIGFYFVKPDSSYWVPCSPNKIFEYLSCGVIPVVRAECDYRDEMRSCGLFFDRNTSEHEISHSLITLLKNPEEMKKKMELCLETGLRFTYDEMACNYLSLYDLLT